jgi:hypothetical protein
MGVVLSTQIILSLEEKREAVEKLKIAYRKIRAAGKPASPAASELRRRKGRSCLTNFSLSNTQRDYQ